MGTTRCTIESASGGRRTRLTEISGVLSIAATRHTGELSRSENSLNQHIKLKHPEAWEKIKGQVGDDDKGSIDNDGSDHERMEEVVGE